jgi:NADPH2:quinone reductase
VKAIQITEYGGPDVLRLVELPTPTPLAGQVVVRTHTIGVGKPDVLLRTGVYKWKPPLPTIVGAEATGTVTAVGAGVSGIALGDSVLLLYAPVGCYAQYIVAPVKNVLPLPRDFDLEVAAHLPNYISAYALLNDAARGTNPATLYVNGSAGGLGIALIQLAVSRGITVIAGASSDEKCSFVKQHGAAHTINYSNTDAIQEVLRLTDGRGVDVIFDQMIGAKFADTLNILAPLGMIVSFNALRGLPEADVFAAMRMHLAKSPAIRCFSGHVYDSNPARLREIHTEVLHAFAKHRFTPPVYAALPLNEARRAHEMLDAREVLGKVLLKP